MLGLYFRITGLACKGKQADDDVPRVGEHAPIEIVRLGIGNPGAAIVVRVDDNKLTKAVNIFHNPYAHGTSGVAGSRVYASTFSEERCGGMTHWKSTISNGRTLTSVPIRHNTIYVPSSNGMLYIQRPLYTALWVSS